MGPKVKKRYAALFIALLILIVGYSQRDQLVTRLLQVGIDRQFSSNIFEELGDGLHVCTLRRGVALTLAHSLWSPVLPLLPMVSSMLLT